MYGLYFVWHWPPLYVQNGNLWRSRISVVNAVWELGSLVHTQFASHDLCAHTCALVSPAGLQTMKAISGRVRWLKTCSANSSFLPGSTLEYSSLAVVCCCTIVDISLVPITYFPNAFFSICVGSEHRWLHCAEKHRGSLGQKAAEVIYNRSWIIV